MKTTSAAAWHSDASERRGEIWRQAGERRKIEGSNDGEIININAGGEIIAAAALDNRKKAVATSDKRKAKKRK